MFQFPRVAATFFSDRTRARVISLSRWLSPAAVGTLCGVVVWGTLWAVLSSFGFDEVVTGGVLLSLTAIAVGGTRWTVSERFLSVCFPLAALQVALLPKTLDWVSHLPAFWGSERILFSAPRALCGLVAALTCLSLVAFVVGLLLTRRAHQKSMSRFVVGTGAGILLSAFASSACGGLQHASLIATTLLMGCWFCEMIWGSPARQRFAANRNANSRGAGQLGVPSAIALMAGIGVALQGRILAQLFTSSAEGWAIRVVAAVVGLLFGWQLARRFSRSAGQTCGAIIAAFSLLLPLAFFERLVHGTLWANATIDNPRLLLGFRAGLAVIFTAALMLGIGWLVGAMRRRGASARRYDSAAVFAGMIGYFLTPFLLSQVGVPAVCIGLAGSLIGGLCVQNFSEMWQRRAHRSVTPKPKLAGFVAAALLVGLSLRATQYEPALAARLLFNTDVFLARQVGFPQDLLPFLDDARLVDWTETDAGTLTIWKQRGETFHLRMNGIPLASRTRRLEICPQPGGEVLKALVPLVLHPSPRNILLLGDAAGSGRAICGRFPVEQIVCRDRDLSGWMRLQSMFNESDDHGDNSGATHADDRVSSQQIVPKLALLADRAHYDLIVSDPGQLSLPAAASETTQEFYQATCQRLAPAGMFCQRLRYADFGPRLLVEAAATLRRVFTRVRIMEIGPGDFLLLGSQTDGSLGHDQQLAQRLQRPHVRAALAEIGWDWCVPLNLLVLNEADLDRLAVEMKAQSNSDLSGRFAQTLPREVIRWGAKWEEVRQTLADCGGRLYETGVAEADQADVLARLAEVTGGRRLMTMYPDQPWAYRKEVRTKLQEQPRSLIQPVAGEIKRVRHPDDARRLHYFELLGEASQRPTVDSLARLERMAVPYDPLVTHFLHHEAVPLYESLGTTGDAAELNHRLQSIYQSDSADRSVRNVAACIQQIVSQAELIPDPADRYDHLEALSQILLNRWRVRGMTEPRSPEVVLIDIEQSLRAIDAAQSEQRKLTAATGIEKLDQQNRANAVRRLLVRPLKTYRGQLLAHVREKEQVTALAEKSPALPSVTTSQTASTEDEEPAPTPQEPQLLKGLIPTGL